MTLGEEIDPTVGSQETKGGKLEILSKRYGPFAHIVDRQYEEVTGIEETPEGKAEIMGQLEELHRNTLKVLSESGVDVTVLEPRDGVQVTENAVTRMIGEGDYSGYGTMSLKEKDAAWQQIWTDAGVINDNEEVDGPLTTAMVQYGKKVVAYEVGDWSERIVPDRDRGKVIPVPANFRTLNRITEDPDRYRVVSGAVSVVNSGQVDIKPAVHEPSSYGAGTLYIIEKASPAESGAAPAAPVAPPTPSTPVPAA